MLVIGPKARNPKLRQTLKSHNSFFFVQSDSTKAQINRLELRNKREQVAYQYLENWSFFLCSPFNVN